MVSAAEFVSVSRERHKEFAEIDVTPSGRCGTPTTGPSREFQADGADRPDQF